VPVRKVRPPIARAIGGILFLLGTILGAYNIWRTIRQAAEEQDATIPDVPLLAPSPIRLQPAE